MNKKELEKRLIACKDELHCLREEFGAFKREDFDGFQKDVNQRLGDSKEDKPTEKEISLWTVFVSNPTITRKLFSKYSVWDMIAKLYEYLGVEYHAEPGKQYVRKIARGKK